MSLSDIDEIQKELKDDTFPAMFTQGATFFNRFMSGAESKQTNNRNYLVPNLLSMAGEARATTFDGDSLANGTGPWTGEMSIGMIGATISFDITDLMQIATNSDKKAIRTAMALYDSNMMLAVKRHFERWMNAGSNDGIAAILSAEAGSVYTLNSNDDLTGGYLLQDGASFQIIASAGFPATIRANSPHRVLPDGSGLNKRANPATVQFAASNGSVAAAIAGWAAEDRVVFFGGANAWFASLPFMVSHLTTGTIQNVSRANPQYRPSRLDGGGNNLSASIVRRLYANLHKYSGSDVSSDDLVPYGSQESIVSWLNEAQSVAAIRLTDADGAGIGEIYDRFLGDVKINKKRPLVSNCANPTQFRFIRLSDFLWLKNKDIGFLPNDAGGRMHRQHDASGNLVTAGSMHITFRGNAGFKTVMNMAVAYNLAKPTLSD